MTSTILGRVALSPSRAIWLWLKELPNLLGASESGKSNLLEAMAKFEHGRFTVDDVPRQQLSPSMSNPDDDMPMISASYELDESDMLRLARAGQKVPSDHTLTFRRNYGGPIYLSGDSRVASRPRNEIVAEIRDEAERFEQQLRRYLRAYSRVRKSQGASDSPLTIKATNRLNKFLTLATQGEAGTRNNWDSQLEESFKNLASEVRALPVALRNRVFRRTADACKQTFDSMRARIQELLKVGNLDIAGGEPFTSRPKFNLVTSEPSNWLTGDYSVDELVSSSMPSTRGIASAKRLLRLAELDLNELRRAQPYMVPSLLQQASETATSRLRDCWLQDPLEIRFEMSTAGIRGIVIYVSSRDHTGLPRQRSYGFRWFLEFLLSYAESQGDQESSVLLFDEPGIHLHPDGQLDLQKLLKREISPNTQVILTTHLPSMLDLTEPEAMRGVMKQAGGSTGTEILNDGYSPTHRKTTWEVMLRAIGVHGPEGFGPGRTVVVEGFSDLQFLLAMAKFLAERDDRARPIAAGVVRLYAAHGARSIRAICNRFIANGSTFAVLLDSDSEGNSAKAVLENEYNPPNRWFQRVVRVTDPQYAGCYFGTTEDDDSLEHELEDLFGPNYT